MHPRSHTGLLLTSVVQVTPANSAGIAVAAIVNGGHRGASWEAGRIQLYRSLRVDLDAMRFVPLHRGRRLMLLSTLLGSLDLGRRGSTRSDCLFGHQA